MYIYTVIKLSERKQIPLRSCSALQQLLTFNILAQECFLLDLSQVWGIRSNETLQVMSYDFRSNLCGLLAVLAESYAGKSKLNFPTPEKVSLLSL